MAAGIQCVFGIGGTCGLASPVGLRHLLWLQTNRSFMGMASAITVSHPPP